ncbi:PilZ domain-containing protein [Erythrobacter sp. KY5]|uniref:PilZ domain-containing protein n=1 Tax=Erythrobacter sp. KY5 TaxID=2011159 RepID=UPI000DBF39CA|nr:PilZ domain-containing protein [Erythrobacter sp. KY5]AWW74611.1 PilZ domain-containing protein [Erythrobacter sp. KY5]
MPTVSRTSQRRPLRLMVKSRVESRAINVDMIDISEGGCKIRGTLGFASVGDRVTMKLANLHAPVGRIAWIEGRIAGVAFEGEIHPAVLDHLCAAQIPDIAAEKDNLRRL